MDNKELKKLVKKYIVDNEFLSDVTSDVLAEQFSKLVDGFDKRILPEQGIRGVVENRMIPNDEEIVNNLVESLYPILQKSVSENIKLIDQKNKMLPRELISHQELFEN